MRLTNVECKIDDIVMNQKTRWLRYETANEIKWGNNDQIISHKDMVERIRILEKDNRFKFWVNGNTLNISDKNSRKNYSEMYDDVKVFCTV